MRRRFNIGIQVRKYKVSTQIRVAIPSLENLHALYLGTLKCARSASGSQVFLSSQASSTMAQGGGGTGGGGEAHQKLVGGGWTKSGYMEGASDPQTRGEADVIGPPILPRTASGH